MIAIQFVLPIENYPYLVPREVLIGNTNCIAIKKTAVSLLLYLRTYFTINKCTITIRVLIKTKLRKYLYFLAINEESPVLVFMAILEKF